jgi:hypothetical protein
MKPPEHPSHGSCQVVLNERRVDPRSRESLCPKDLLEVPAMVEMSFRANQNHVPNLKRVKREAHVT